MRKTFYAIAALAAGVALAPAAQAQIVTNGNFSSGLTGWTIGSGSVTTGSTGGTYVPDTFALFGQSNTTGGSLYQTFATTIGTRYVLSFKYGEYGSGSGEQDLEYTVFSGSKLVDFTASGTGPNSTYSDSYTYGSAVSVSFTAASASTTIGFLDKTTTPNSGNADGILTSVVVRNVPEPISMTLLLTGIVGLGAVRMRKPT